MALKTYECATEKKRTKNALVPKLLRKNEKCRTGGDFLESYFPSCSVEKSSKIIDEPIDLANKVSCQEKDEERHLSCISQLKI